MVSVIIMQNLNASQRRNKQSTHLWMEPQIWSTRSTRTDPVYVKGANCNHFYQVNSLHFNQSVSWTCFHHESRVRDVKKRKMQFGCARVATTCMPRWYHYHKVSQDVLRWSRGRYQVSMRATSHHVSTHCHHSFGTILWYPPPRSSSRRRSWVDVAY